MPDFMKKQFGLELRQKIENGDENKEISKWAFEVYMNHASEFEEGLRDYVFQLVFMEEGPEFDLSMDELKKLVRELTSDAEGVSSDLACRVCGYIQRNPPWGKDGQSPTYDICHCCGTAFGCEDCTLKEIRELREKWLNSGANWVYPDEKPVHWLLEEQLRQIPYEFE